jgi:hypothetical protein
LVLIVEVIDWLNGPAGDVASNTFGELLLIVSVSLLGGVAPRVTDPLSTCRFIPKVVAKFGVSCGAVTVAVIWVAVVGVGVLNPLGVVIVRLVVPAVSGWKLAVTVLKSAVKVTELGIVPTAVLELPSVTVTAVAPVRSSCTPAFASVVGFSCTSANVKVVFSENVVVGKFPFSHSTPDGTSVTVVVPVV